MKYSDFLKAEKGCPFDTPIRQIVLAENASAFLTYALAPYSRDHWLVVPKRHVANLTELTHQERDDTDALLARGSTALRALCHKGISILLRQGEDLSPYRGQLGLNDVELSRCRHLRQEKGRYAECLIKTPFLSRIGRLHPTEEEHTLLRTDDIREELVREARSARGRVECV